MNKDSPPLSFIPSGDEKPQEVPLSLSNTPDELIEKQEEKELTDSCGHAKETKEKGEQTLSELLDLEDILEESRDPLSPLLLLFFFFFPLLSSYFSFSCSSKF